MNTPTTCDCLMRDCPTAPFMPVEEVVGRYFSHLSVVKFVRKCTEGAIELAIVSPDTSQKAAKFVHIEDLATLLDNRTSTARRDHERFAQLHRMAAGLISAMLIATALYAAVESGFVYQ